MKEKKKEYIEFDDFVVIPVLENQPSKGIIKKSQALRKRTANIPF